MTEKLLNGMDENYETTKNESRDSAIGFLQFQVANMYPKLVEQENSFFWDSFYFSGEKVNTTLLENGQAGFEQLKQSQIETEKVNTLQ